MARSRSKTGSDLGSYWTENVTWPLLCPYRVPVTLLPREEDPPVTSEMSWLETPEEEDGGEGRERNLHAGMLMTLMRERKREESFNWSFPIFLDEDEEEEEERETEEHLRQGTRKSLCSGMVGIKAEEDGERPCKPRAGEVAGLIFLVSQLKLL